MALEGRFPEVGAADDRGARRGPAAGPAHDPAHAHVRARERQRRRAPDRQRPWPAAGCERLERPDARVLAQINQSDLAFLRDRARAADADVWVEGKTLHAAARASRTDSRLELVHGARLREFAVCADLAHQRTAVVCGGLGRRRPSARSQSRRPRRAIAARGRTTAPAGPTVLQQALGAAQGHGRPRRAVRRRRRRARWPRRICARLARRFVVGAASPSRCAPARRQARRRSAASARCSPASTTSSRSATASTAHRPADRVRGASGRGSGGRER